MSNSMVSVRVTLALTLLVTTSVKSVLPLRAGVVIGMPLVIGPRPKISPLPWNIAVSVMDSPGITAVFEATKL
jgi:hypothetical protein